MTSFLANDGHVPHFFGLSLKLAVFLLLPFIFRFHFVRENSLPSFTLFYLNGGSEKQLGLASNKRRQNSLLIGPL